MAKTNKNHKNDNTSNNHNKSDLQQNIDTKTTTKSMKNMSLKEKFKYFRDNITVEPLLACYIMPGVLSGLATQNLNLEKACRVNLGYAKEVCEALSRRETANYTMEEESVQQIVAKMQGWKTIIQSLLPSLLILFWGSWSDRHGRRKPCILIPILGEIITSIGLILCTYFENTRMEVAGITESLFPGITGGWPVTLMGVFSYIADVTTEEERTLRIGIVNLCFSLGVPIGMAFSGILLKKIGFYGVFGLTSSLYIFSFIYGLLCLKEPKKKTKEELEKSTKKNIIADFFDKKHVVETFKVAFKKGPNKRRLRVITLIVVVMVVIGPLYGEMAVGYLFTRYRFNWSEVEYSFFSTYAMVTGLLGTLFSVGFLSHKLKIDDALIGVLSSMSKILSSFVYAFAVTDWQMYVGAIVEILNGTSFIAMRSIATKLVNKDELGKINSLFGVAEALMPLIYIPMYTTLYTATLNVLPGAFFILGGVLTAPAVAIFFWMYNLHCKDRKAAAALAAGEIKKDEKSIENGIKDKSIGIGIINPSYVKDANDDNDYDGNNDIEHHHHHHHTAEIVKEIPIELPTLKLETCNL